MSITLYSITSIFKYKVCMAMVNNKLFQVCHIPFWMSSDICRIMLALFLKYWQDYEYLTEDISLWLSKYGEIEHMLW